ncbi:MAG: aldo/keto reductase, partial [Candidatus Electrothrix sp. AR5]|nr:aldo/keto reductase [Candidatus Electrothrix sp. AR5]
MINVKLNNSLTIPIIGLGTFPMKSFELFKAVYYALRSGYTHFDTASAYGNERALGFSLNALKLFGLTEQRFITTKLSNNDQKQGDVRKSLLRSMSRLNVKNVDLYLMHWPYPETYLDSWKQMEGLYQEGLVKAIGVCNFHQHHLEQLLEIATVFPAVNQIELHPLISQSKLRYFCENSGIALEAYSPVARMDPKLIKNKVLLEISRKYNKTVPQVIFRWDIQHGIITIP